MIKFHIPGIMSQHEINKTLISLFNNNREYFYDDIAISGVYGVFMPCMWNGGRTIYDDYRSNEERIDIINYYNSNNIGIIYTFTNVMLEPRMYADYICMQDVQNILHNTDINKIIVADTNLKEFIESKYNNVKFILSTTSDIVIDNKIEALEKYEDEYDLIVPRYFYNNKKELLSINNPSKYEILLNPQCVGNCTHEKEHYKNISMLNLDMLTVNDTFECPYQANLTFDIESLMKYDTFITVDDLYKKYKEKGFTTFKINGRSGGRGDVLSYYIYYMVKPEYYDNVLNAFKPQVDPNYFKRLQEIFLDEQSSQ